jgi:hypothetical protein
VPEARPVISGYAQLLQVASLTGYWNFSSLPTERVGIPVVTIMRRCRVRHWCATQRNDRLDGCTRRSILTTAGAIGLPTTARRDDRLLGAGVLAFFLATDLPTAVVVPNVCQNGGKGSRLYQTQTEHRLLHNDGLHILTRLQAVVTVSRHSESK